MSTDTESCSCHEVAAETSEQRRTLGWVLGINLVQSSGGLTVGALAGSTALVGAALDNLSDAAVYAITLYAVGRSALAKARVARLSGSLLILFATLLVVEVVRRFFAGSEPIGTVMMAAAFINAMLNIVCLKLLAKHRNDNVALRASSIFTSNDTWANLGIVVSGALVWITTSPVPDLVVGLVVAYIAFRGGREILSDAADAAKEARKQHAGESHV